MCDITVSVDPLTESNCYIISENQFCVVIDPGESQKLLRTLHVHGWTPELILLTHEHCDHMAGLEALRDACPQARFFATEKCSAGIASTRLNLSGIMEIYLFFRGKPGIHYEPFVCRPADEIVAENAVITWREHSFRLIPLPGHTPGSSGIMLDERVLFSGDYLIEAEEPVLRFPGGDEEVFHKITEPYLNSLPEGLKVCPGHKGSFVVTHSS